MRIAWVSSWFLPLLGAGLLSAVPGPARAASDIAPALVVLPPRGAALDAEARLELEDAMRSVAEDVGGDFGLDVLTANETDRALRRWGSPEACKSLRCDQKLGRKLRVDLILSTEVRRTRGDMLEVEMGVYELTKVTKKKRSLRGRKNRKRAKKLKSGEARRRSLKKLRNDARRGVRVVITQSFGDVPEADRGSRADRSEGRKSSRRGNKRDRYREDREEGDRYDDRRSRRSSRRAKQRVARRDRYEEDERYDRRDRRSREDDDEGDDDGSSGSQTAVLATLAVASAAASTANGCGTSTTAGCNQTRYGRRPMRATAFRDLLQRLDGGFDNDRAKLLKSVARDNVFTVAQVTDVTKKFSFDDARKDAVALLAPRVVDPENAQRVGDAFSFSSSKQEAISLIARQG